VSEDEILILLVAAVVAVIAWFRWFYGALAVRDLVAPQRDRIHIYLIPFPCMAGLFSILRDFASHDVRDSGVYLTFYMVMGAAWIGFAAGLTPLMGISVRDDSVERRNHAATIALTGALFGITFCFAGGNVGDGPGWWVVVFSAILSTDALFAL
jgi:RsiW-degrading membrane proteinase PrsW (M82 family)